MRQAVLVLVCGCGFVAEGTGTGATDTDSDGGETSAADVFGTWTGPSSASASSTSVGSSTSSTATSSTDEGTTSSTDEGTTSSTDEGTTSSTSSAELDPYNDCWPDWPSETCPGSCMVGTAEGEPSAPSACAPECGRDDECPSVDAIDGACLPSLVDVVTPYVCVLPCEIDGLCPDGMACVEVESYDDPQGNPLRLCLW